MVGLRSITSFKRTLRVKHHVFMQLCIKLIIMEESTKENFFKPKFELVQECNGLVSIHLGKLTLLRATSRDRNHWNHPGRSSNVGGVSYNS
jgi:hypothetical protein